VTGLEVVDVRSREPVLDLDGYPPRFVAPACRWVPPRSGSYADEVVDFTSSLGHPVDVEQAADLDAMCSFGPGGLPVAGETWMLEGRQNGKTDRVVLPQTLFDFFVGPRGRIVDWTSHLVDTTLKTKRIVDQLIEGNPVLSRRVRAVVDARGSEGIYLHRLPGEPAEREWRWASRSEGAGRGGPADVWVADEGLFLSAGMVGARRPTLRSREGAQLRGASSAALRRSGYLRSVVKRGRAGGDLGLVYVERCAPGGFDGSACVLGAECSHVYGVAEGCALDDESTWHLANHALARGRITYRKMRDERSSMDATEFAREGAGWHEPGADDAGGTVDVETWDRFADRSSAIADGRAPAAFVVGVRPDQSGSSIAVVGRRADGRLHVGLIRHGALAGDELVAEVMRLRREHRPRRVLVLAGASASSVAAGLKRRGRVQVVGPVDQATAAADLLAGIRADDFRHRGDRIVRASLEAASSRRTPDGAWSFDTREGDGSVLPVLVVVVARWAATQVKAYDPMKSFG
jgi:hypothetical protein